MFTLHTIQTDVEHDNIKEFFYVYIRIQNFEGEKKILIFLS